MSVTSTASPSPDFDSDLQLDAEVLATELEALRVRREALFGSRPDVTAFTGGAGAGAGGAIDAGAAAGAAAAAAAAVAAIEGATTPREEERVRQLGVRFADAHRMRPFGLAFSGGGIRSATFNLGLLQGLAEMQLVKHVDYLSTVSGGGYIGSWFHALVRSRRCMGNVREAERILSSETNPAPGMAYEDAIAFLRKYSNYLAPSPGLFSADTWVIGSIWLRNVLLNQLILIPTFVAVILSMILIGFGYQAAGLQTSAESTLGIIAGLLPLGLGLAIACGNLRDVQARTHQRRGIDTPQEKASAAATAAAPGTHTTPAEAREKAPSRFTEHFRYVGPLMFLSGLMLSWAHLSLADLRAEFPSPRTLVLTAGLFGLFLALQEYGGFPECYTRARQPDPDKPTPTSMRVRYSLLMVLMAAASAALALAMLVGFWSIPFPDDGWGPWVRLTIGPPMASASLITGVVLLIGLMGVDYPDAGREWLARAGAVTSLYCAAWAAVFAVGIMGPFALAKLLTKYFAIGVAALGGWLLTTVTGVLAGQSARTKTSGDEPPQEGAGNKALAFVASVAPSLFLLGYILFVGIGVHVSLARIAGVTETKRYVAEPTETTYTVEVSGTAPAGAPGAPIVVPGSRVTAVPSTPGTYTVDVKETPVVGWIAGVLTPVATFQLHYFEALDYLPATAQTVFLGLIVMLVVTVIASLRININEFSLHHFYKNRLVRCYLGAAKAERRQASPFTGFDPRDDFPLAELLPRRPQPNDPPHTHVYSGPFAIVNTALNLNVGSELAKQERKATSFIFTPAYCGFHPAVSRRDNEQAIKGGQDDNSFQLSGYTKTRGYSEPSGPRIGTAMAISGAAANPNSGCHTSGPMAFLLTVFDARLGWWLGNPRWPLARKDAGPRIAWYYLFRELLGLTTGRSQFVNLSDGGHFENLGLYELVRRRCRYIVVCDSEEDRRFTFEGLGGAVRKCRADFGVEIEINPEPIRLRSVAGERLSGAHCVVGRITYPEQEEGRTAEFAGHGYPDPTRAAQIRERSAGRATGWLLYIKSSVTGDEPADILEYRTKFVDFPHQTTGDQFFTESQFESYRRLGLHVARHAFEGIDEPRASGDPEVELLEVFQQLAQKWYVPTGVDQLEAAQLTQAYAQLLRTTATSTPLPALAAHVLPRLPSDLKPGDDPKLAEKTGLDPREMVLTLEAIQLMQNVFVAYRLEIPANRNNPRIAGWLAVFKRWVESEEIARVWVTVQGDYNPLFQKFMRDLRSENIRTDSRRP